MCPAFLTKVTGPKVRVLHPVVSDWQDLSVVSPEMCRDQPRLLAALDMASAAIAKVRGSLLGFCCHIIVCQNVGEGALRPWWRSDSILIE